MKIIKSNLKIDFINNQENGNNMNYEMNEEFSNNWFEFF